MLGCAVASCQVGPAMARGRATVVFTHLDRSVLTSRRAEHRHRAPGRRRAAAIGTLVRLRECSGLYFGKYTVGAPHLKLGQPLYPLFKVPDSEVLEMAIGDGDGDGGTMKMKVIDAGGFKKYEQAHLAALTATFAPKLRLPARPARLVAEYWGHVGFY